MKITKPSVDIEPVNGKVLVENLESYGRICYKSGDRIKEGSAEKFIKGAIKRGHFSVIEHEKVTAKIKCDRGVTHEIVRHRIGSYCLSGDTKILRFNQNKKHLTIKELYERQLDPQLSGRNKLMLLRSINKKNIIIPNKIKKITKSGKKGVYELKTKLGYKIKCSKDHIFFNNKGEKALKDFKAGDKVFVNGELLIKDKNWLKEKYHTDCLSLNNIALLSNCSYFTVRKYITTHGLQKPLGSKPEDFKPWNKGLTENDDPRVKLQANALRDNHYTSNKKGEYHHSWKGNSVKTESGLRLRFSKYKKEKCALCGNENKLENHHKDNDHKNWKESNKTTLCTLCHKLVHKGYNIKKVIEDTIVSIKYIGSEMTYDIEMRAPYHNFIADGFVVHNSQESTRYVNYKEGITVIEPVFWKNKPKIYNMWLNAMLEAEKSYIFLIENGAKPEEARTVLPNSLKTEIIVTFNMREWRHFFYLRCSPGAHIQIREIGIMLLKKMREVIPVLFDDFIIDEEKLLAITDIIPAS